MVLHFAGAGRRNQLGKRLPANAGERKVNNVGVAEQVVKKRFDRFQRVGSAELKENYPHTRWLTRHFPQNPQNAGRLLRTKLVSQWEGIGKVLVPELQNAFLRGNLIECQSCPILPHTSLRWNPELSDASWSAYVWGVRSCCAVSSLRFRT